MKIDKLWGSRLKKDSAKGLVEFTSGRDIRCTKPCDERLIPYDVWGSKAHVIMLWKQGVVAKKEVRTILKGLDEIEISYRKGKFTLDPTKEDVHSTIESYLIKHYGMESAGRLHTGRSRNDQVVVDMRLYLRAEVLDCTTLLLNLIDVFTEVAKVHVNTIMPGYTHHQPAMVSSWGHLLFSYALSLERDVERLVNWYTMFNFNPLGGAASYGTRLPLDRDLTAQLMGFDGVHESSLDPSQNRWEPEVELCYGISIMMNHLSNLAQTLIILSTSEFDMVKLDDAYCTGSSIMPQKRNPGPLEVIKGKAAYTQGMVVALLSMGRSLFAGYNKDSQWSKYPVMDVIDECKPSLTVMKEIVKSLRFDKKTALRWCERAFITATDVVEWLVQKHSIPFREAKVVVEKAVKYSEREVNEKITFKALKQALKEMKIKVKIKERDVEECQVPERVLKERKTKGGPSPEVLKGEVAGFQKALKLHKEWLKLKVSQVERAQAEVRKIVKSLI
jgi:argininosuccinate lyase